jgi:formylmethanofuran dehydrogenase subunit E
MKNTPISKTELCGDCEERIATTEAYAIKDKTGKLLCLSCADHYYDVTLVDAGVTTEHLRDVDG